MPRSKRQFLSASAGLAFVFAVTGSIFASAQEVLPAQLFATPSIIKSGEKVLLNWDASDADYCEASGGWSGRQEPSGYLGVSPKKKLTRFGLKCYSEDGTLVSETIAVVKVTQKKVKRNAPLPVVTLKSNVSRLKDGEVGILSWSAKNAVFCRGLGTDDDWKGLKKLKGKEEIVIESDQTYSLTCFNKDGKSTSGAEVAIRYAGESASDDDESVSQSKKQESTITPFSVARPLISFLASPAKIQAGEQVTLAWNASNAKYCKFLTPSSSDFASQYAPKGSVIVKPPQSTEYKLQCVNIGENAESYDVSTQTIEVVKKDEPQKQPPPTVPPGYFQPPISIEKFDILSVAVKEGEREKEKNPNKRWFEVKTTHPWTSMKVELYEGSFTPGKKPQATALVISNGSTSVVVGPQAFSTDLMDLYHNTKYTYVVTAWKGADSHTQQGTFTTGTQFELTSVEPKNVNASGETTEEQRAFGVNANYPFAKLQIEIFEAANSTLYTSWTLDASSNPMSSVLTHPSEGIKNLRAYTKYSYKVTAWLPGEIDSPRYSIKQGSFTTGSVTVKKSNAELATAFSFSQKEWGAQEAGSIVILEWDAYGASYCKYLGTNPFSQGMFMPLYGTYQVAVGSSGAMHYMKCDYPNGLSITKDVLVRPKNDPYGLSFGYIGTDFSHYIRRTELDDVFLWGGVEKPPAIKVCSILDRSDNSVVSLAPTHTNDGIWEFKPKISPQSTRHYEFTCRTQAGVDLPSLFTFLTIGD